MSKTGILEYKVITNILDAMNTQGFSVGHRLPNEREQSRQLGVSRDTVRRSLAHLEKYGIVERRHGSGTYLRRPIENPKTISEKILRSEILSKKDNGGPNGKTADFLPNIYGGGETLKYRIAYLSDNLNSNGRLSREILAGVCVSAQEAGHETLIGSSRPGKEAVVYDEFSKTVYNTDCDGIVLSATFRPNDLKNLGRIQVPYILVAGSSSVIADNSIMLDSPLALRRAVSQLAHDGHEKILVIETGQSHQTPSFQYICEQLKREMSLPELDFLYGEHPGSDIDFENLPYTGIFFTDSRFARGFIQKLSAFEKELGRDYEAITISYSNVDSDLPMELGRVEFDLFEFGHQSLRSLIHRLTQKNVVLPPMRIGPKFVEPLKVSV